MLKQALDECLDCLVIGGGAAGLTAALYLGRYRRRTLVLDDGGSRMALIPKSHNVLGFPDGIAGPELLERMRSHVARFDVPMEPGRVTQLLQMDDGGFEAVAGTRRLLARKVILATGARDVEPEIAGLGPALKAGRVRYCPVCDGYETQGQRVAVLGREIHGLRESQFISCFDNQVTWLSMGSLHAVCADDLARMRALGVNVANGELRHIHCSPDAGVRVQMNDGDDLPFDVLYPALGLVHASELATAIGARAQEDGQLEVDDHFQTTVPGLYAAGDVVLGLNQISVASGQAAIAATAIHNCL